MQTFDPSTYIATEVRLRVHVFPHLGGYELIARNPCASAAVRAPSVPAGRIVPWTREGETFGLEVDAVDFLRHTVHVRQQVKLLAGKPIFAPPKGGKIREVPLPEWVAVALAEHLRRHPPIEVTLPWRDLDGPPRTSRLIFTSRESGPINRNYFNPHIWKPSLKAVKLPTTRDHGMHAASLAGSSMTSPVGPIRSR